MSLPDSLLADLADLTPAQLRAATAYMRALRVSNPLAEDLAASTESPGMFLTLDAVTLAVTESDSAFSALVRHDPRGANFLELIDPEYRESAGHAFEFVRRHKGAKKLRLRIRRPEDESLPVTLTAQWVEGQPPLIDIVCRDISHFKRIGTLEILSEMLSIGIVLVDEDGRIALANSFAESMFGYESGELAHKPAALLFQDIATVVQRIPSLDPRVHAAIRPEQELQGRTKDGSLVELKIGWSAIRLNGHRFAVASITDVTAHKSIEGALRQHEEQRALMFSEGLLGDFTWDIKADSIEAHPTVFELYGSAPIDGPVPGAWFRSRQHPDDAPGVEKTWRSQLESGQDLAVEFRVLGADGILRWIDCRGIAVRDAQGVPLKVHGLNIDMTARKQAEAERRASEARALRAEDLLRTALQYSNTVVWRWNIDDDTTEWSGAVRELFGLEPSKLIGWSDFRKIVLPADLSSIEAALTASFGNGSEFHHEFRIVRPDGQVRWITGRAGVLRDAGGRIYGMAGVNLDVTKRKIIEAGLTQSERDFRELANVIPQVAFTADVSGAIEYVNRRYYELTGVSENIIINLSWPEIIAAEDRPRSLKLWLDCVVSGDPFELEARIWDHGRQQYRWYLTRSVPVRNAEGGIVRWIGTATDIHDQKTLETRLESEVQSRTLDLGKSLAEKDALLREIHHRVKNNLQIVSSLLRMQAACAASSAAVAPLRDSERRITSMAMIHEQLYETDDMQTVEFDEHARRLSQTLFSSMAESSLFHCRLDLHPVKLNIHRAIPCALILNELLTNAIKYAYPDGCGGEVVVRLSDDSGWVTLTVSDQGVGLPAHIDPHAPKTLGLEIVQVLVGQLEGELIVRPSPGASFTVKFPLQRDSPKESRPSHSEALNASEIIMQK